MCSASCLLSAVCYVSSTASTSPKQNNNKMQNNKMQNNKKQKQEKREGASNSRFTSATQSSQRRGRHTASATPKDASPARPASPYSAFERMSFSRCASWNTRSTCSVWFWFCLFCVCVCVCVLGDLRQCVCFTHTHSLTHSLTHALSLLECNADFLICSTETGW